MKKNRVLPFLLAGGLAVAAISVALVRAGGHTESPLLELQGEVEIRQADLGFNVDGPIASVLVEEGEHVKAGQVLARLEPDAYRFNLANAEASLTNAEEVLRQFRNGFRPQEIEQSRANLSAAEAAQRLAHLSDQRNQSLVGQQYVSQAETDQSRSQAESADAALRQARADLSLKLQGTRIETIAQAEAQVKAAEANRDYQKYRLSHTEIQAPNDGIILTRIREPGSIVAANAPVLTLSVIKPLWIRAYVDEPNLDRVIAGAAVIIATDSPKGAGTGKHYHGHIGFVAPTAEFTPKSVATPELRTSLVYRLRVVVDDGDETLRQGMPATVQIDRAGAALR